MQYGLPLILNILSYALFAKPAGENSLYLNYRTRSFFVRPVFGLRGAVNRAPPNT
jgi:hypothetical protein